MQYHFSFKHMNSSTALQNYAEQKLSERIQKFVTKAIAAHVTFSVQRHQQTVHLSLDAGDGFDIEVQHTAEDMYAAVDFLADKLTAQLKKQKEKLKDHKGERVLRNLPIAQYAEAEAVDADDILKYEAARRKFAR
jgi:putative sigma-54 modulation protein